ncbi:MAG: putative toxin-antitoxin system toxin component, PIN family [bacterium]
MKAVIDTNVFMAALINKRGAPAKIYYRWLDSQFDLVISPAIEVEYNDVLSQSLLIPLGEVQEFLQEVSARSMNMPISGALHVCKDPDDDIFLETAMTGKADFLVTKNLKHFPKKSYQGVKIVKVSVFLRELEKTAS